MAKKRKTRKFRPMAHEDTSESLRINGVTYDEWDNMTDAERRQQLKKYEEALRNG
jgi:hypothetical protein